MIQAYLGEKCAICKQQPQTTYNRRVLRYGKRVSMCDDCHRDAMDAHTKLQRQFSKMTTRQLQLLQALLKENQCTVA